MNNPLEYFSDDYEEQETNSNPRRMTRIIPKGEIQLLDQSSFSNSESDDSYSEETGQNSPSKKNETTDDMIDRVKGMTQDDMRELLNKLNLSEDDENPKGKVYKEDTNDIEDKQQKNKQRAQAKTVNKEGRKNKEEIEAKTSKEDKKNKEGIENSSENTNNKTKKGVRGKKNNSKSTNIDAQSEENLDKFENKNETKFVGIVHSDNRKDENLTITSKPDNIDCFQEQNQAKTEKIGLQKTNKEKQTKSSKRAGADNTMKESENNALEHVDNHVEGRVMRSTRSKQEHSKNVLKEINEPLKDMVPATVTSQNKKNVKKFQAERRTPEENLDPIITEEGAAGKTKKTGKKGAAELKKLEETDITNATSEEENPIKSKKTGKKVVSEIIKESQKNHSSSVKEDAIIQTQKNHNKNNSVAVQNTVQKELIPIEKSTRSKKKPTNSKINEVIEEPQLPPIRKEKAKTGPVKNKQILDNKENKINEDTVPNKRAARKK